MILRCPDFRGFERHRLERVYAARTLTLLLLLLIVSGGSGVSARAAEIDFAHDIVPLLKTHCGKCHTGEERQGGLSMNTRQVLLAGGDDGPVVIPKSAERSDLIRRVLATDDTRMPPEGAALNAEQVAALRKWIDAGAPWTAGFSFQGNAYEPPLRPREVSLPPAVDGRSHPIDRLVDAYWGRAKAGAAQPAAPRPEPLGGASLIGDGAFLRRASLDLTGLLPTPERRAAFLADPRADKRERLVRELLADEIAYADHWLSFWNDLLRNDYTGTGFITGGRKQITGWLHRSLVENKPFDQMVRELTTPTPESEGFIGGIQWRGNTNSSQTVQMQFAQNITQAFLGINMKCASCHNSFIDRWTLRETYSLAAVFSTEPLTLHRCDKSLGEVATPGWIFPELGAIDPQAPQPERMRQLAELLTHPENGRLSRTIVNRLWHRTIGRGIVHPVDAMHTPPWDADLLDYLAVDLSQHHYDLKRTLELICTSQTYQMEMAPRPLDGADVVSFRGPLARRLTAEQFMDAVWQITGAAPRRADAAVIRRPPHDSDSDPAAPLRARWVWAYPEGSSNQPKAGETVTFRNSFQLDKAPLRAVAAVTCDNEYELFCNGKRVHADGDWNTVEVLELASHLKAGENTVLIVARNAGSAPNPAGLLFELRVAAEPPVAPPPAIGAGKPAAPMIVVATGSDWQWTAARPNARGQFSPQPKDWQSAKPVAHPQVWQTATDELTLALAAASGGELPMVRASLINNNAFLRALGRPTRDQIVTMRPSELTTLEAIDLTNGQLLADAIGKGAAAASARHAGDSGELVRWLFHYALSRPPTAAELQLSQQLLGPSPDAQSLEDLMWSVFMLPEFQLVQ